MNDFRLQQLRDTVDRQSDGKVLSVFCRTDPREPENSGEHPGWMISLKNGIRDALEAIDPGHESHKVAQRLAEEAERRILETPAHERGRSIACFLSEDGLIDELHTFQIPVRDGFVTFDSGPVVWPIVDVVDRGQRTGIVLMSNDNIRLLEWFDGTAEDIEPSDREDDFGTHDDDTRAHIVNFMDRVKEWRNQFQADSIADIADAVSKLGYDRLIVAADGELGSHFESSMPDPLGESLIEIVPINLIDHTSADVAEHLDERLREDWRESVGTVADQALARVKAADRGAGGPDETLLALSEGRVGHVIFDPYLETKSEILSDGAIQAIEDAGEASIQEALVEVALRTDARMSSASAEEVPALAEAGGVLATLRY
ncbi:MAG: hypothetical protein IPK93_11810 [Solirubrobacterales bacterium]|nr:hypothetical protein [Solirubrobacterales bacterium]